MGRFLKSAALVATVAAAASLPGTALHAADAKDGAHIFASDCAVCHASKKDAPPKFGPDLFGVVGRKAGTYPGYNYSPAMKNSKVVWTPEELRKYLESPNMVVHGNKMPFGGVHNEDKVEDLIAYLSTLK